MKTAKIFENGESQAVPLPKSFRLSSEKAFAQRQGNTVTLVPKESSWRAFLNGVNGFTDDFLESGRSTEIPTKRDTL